MLPHVYLQVASAKVDTFATNANKLRDVTGRATRTLQQTIAAIEAELEVTFGDLSLLLLLAAYYNVALFF